MRALQEADRLGRVEERAPVINGLGFLELAAEDWSEADRWFAAAAEEFAMVGHRAGVAMAEANRGYALLKLGRLGEAAELTERAAEAAGALGRVAVVADALTTRALVARSAGDLVEAARWAHAAEDAAVESGDPDLRAAALDLLASLDSAGGGGPA